MYSKQFFTKLKQTCFQNKLLNEYLMLLKLLCFVNHGSTTQQALCTSSSRRHTNYNADEAHLPQATK